MTEENVMKLVETIAPGDNDEQYLIVSGSNSRLYTRYNPPLEFQSSNAGHELALCRLETYYSFPNIDSSNNSLCVSIDNGKNWLHLLIPTGVYDIDAINNVIHGLISNKNTNDGKAKEKYFALRGNRNTLKCELEIIKESTIVDFNVENSIGQVLGFKAKKYKGGGKTYESENIVNILRVNSILVHCDVVKPTRLNGIFAPVIYSFFPNVSPGQKIVHQPKHLNYVPLAMNFISSMTSWITDQKNNLLELNEQQLTLTFHIRKRR